MAAPLICFFIAVGLVFYEVHRLHQLRDDTRQTQQQIAQIDKMLREITQHPVATKIPAVGISPTEQVDFLNMLRLYANESKVRLTRWSNATPIAPSSSGTASADAHKAALPPGVTSVASAIEVGGHYAGVRQFLYYLLSDRRLINMTDLKWSRDQWPTTKLTFTLTRYISQQAAPAAPASTPSTGAAPAATGSASNAAAQPAG